MPENYVRPDDVAAICLVGGEGTRLGALTWYRTKAAVMAGPSILAAYSTSNALNSGIDRIILPAQYLPQSLQYFYAKVHGADFGPFKKIHVITPFDTIRGNGDRKAVYNGTSEAYYHGLKTARRHRRKYILGLSGDHVLSKLDFTQLFNTYLDTEKFDPDSFVVFTKKVSRQDAPRLGILETETGGTRVASFREKPPKEELDPKKEIFNASMGIYFGPLDVWLKLLEVDRERVRNGESVGDIGKNVIPYAVQTGDFPVHSFSFDGFWADVGEPHAFRNTLDLVFFERSPNIFGGGEFAGWPIDSLGVPHTHGYNSHIYVECGEFEPGNSSIEQALFSPGVRLNRAEIKNSIFLGRSESEGRDTIVGSGAYVENAVVDKMCDIDPGAVIRSENGIMIVARDTHIRSRVRAESTGDGVTATIDEMARNYDNLLAYTRHAGGVQLFDASGLEVQIGEVQERMEKLRREGKLWV